MDGLPVQRTTAPAQSAAPVRTESVPVRPSATMEQAPDRVVQPVGEAPAVRLDIPGNADRLSAAFELVDREQSFDQDANRVVVTWVDQGSGEVVRQFPTEHALKMRAYAREQLRDAGSGGSDGNAAKILI